jgi:hypothetical protein
MDDLRAEGWLVVCLCAEWCGVCREYRSRFEQVLARLPQVRRPSGTTNTSSGSMAVMSVQSA